MKKIAFCAFAFCVLAQFVFAQKNSSSQELLVQFAKGNILDKTDAVKRSGEDSSLAKKALDFVVDNSDLLKNDRDLAALAVAGILSYPVAEYKNDPQTVINEFESIFNSINDANVKISIFEKIAALYSEQSFTGSVSLANNYLMQKISNTPAPDDTVKKAIEVLGKIGDGSSFAPLYSIIKSNKWSDIHLDVNAALVAIADKSLNEIVNTVNAADLVELRLLSQIYEKNDKISSTLRSEIADKMLNRAIIISGRSSPSKDLAEFQLSAAEILSENQWTRAAELGKNYFNVAKQAYDGKYLSEEQFAKAIGCVEKLCSRGAVKPFSEYMDQMNKAQEGDNAPSKTVVLAVINALGSLGDKSAFDCLLYVTYLDYSEDITAAARNALTRLKW